MADPIPDDTPARTARVANRPPTHYWRRGGLNAAWTPTRCCDTPRSELPRGHATTTDWSLVTCPEHLAGKRP